MKISEGLDFILSHFKEPIFPRTISTNVTGGSQFMVTDKSQALTAYQSADCLDCRINAYPAYTGYKGVNRQEPNFIFIDLDGTNFVSPKALKLALTATLKNIGNYLHGKPTVICSGHGYHIYQPIEAILLEEISNFSDFEQPSQQFLRFAERYLSGNKSDPFHNPSFRSCMVRIPGSYNSRCILEGTNSEVRVVQIWNGFRPGIKNILGSFYAYLVSEKLGRINYSKKWRQKKRGDSPVLSNDGRGNKILWIERLLNTPIVDFRKNSIALILAPYLLNVRKLSYSEAFDIIKKWIIECNSIRPLDSPFDYRIKYALNYAARRQIMPIKIETLKTKNNALYEMLKGS